MSRTSDPKSKGAALLVCAASDCDVEFTPSRSTQKYCSRICGKRESNQSGRAYATSGTKSPAIDVVTDDVLRRENAHLRNQVRRLAEGEQDAERVIRRLEGAVELLAPTYSPSAPSVSPRTSKRMKQEFVLLFSDTHASEVVSLEETRGINEYNWNIMLERIAEIRRSLLSHKEHFGFEISKLNVYMLGDMISGDIHDELAITNDRPTAEAIVQLAYDVGAWIDSLAGEFSSIHVAGVIGNHPRTTKKPAMKQAHNNGDWLFYQLLKALLAKNERVTFDFPRGAFSTQMLCGKYRAFLLHGDGIRSTMPGVPWGGVTRRVTQMEAQMAKAREPLDYVFMGHWHSPQSLAGIQSKTWINGSVKGADEYGLKNFGMGHDASQTLLTIHPDRGWTGQYPIQLQDFRAASEGW